MADLIASKRYLIAGYGLPAEFGVMTLFGMGVSPDQIAVLTHADDSRNQGLHAIAALRGISIWEQPAKAPSSAAWAKTFAPDVLLSLHYRNLIPKQILELAPLGAVNLHPSLLPNYRGTNSVAWVIINGESETGFTFHRMDERFDTGPILLQEKLAIHPNDTAFSLFHRQIVRAMARLETVIERVAAGDPGLVQPADGSYFPRTLPHGGLIDVTWPSEKIERFIRAMYFPPFPPAGVMKDGEVHAVASVDEYKKLFPKHA
ncbi:methionyl-tRNA formyltransferase [Bradyrhizobium japonicum]|uniref:methionyl-tRNA formyltransferase n=1 Tax=Bradyrhizobium TaxID=374 RepID=UPI0004B224DF|nr:MULTISPECIES: methionyl-tRNA formyltransferase [Bradyrhizobium]MBR1033811.1 methionyl-tRNA formyltransferase [Bradyrhizobium liaoningense]MDI2077417.1 methionyl-tRNA formyltransferase [Bradyrhizobium sp. Mp27]